MKFQKKTVILIMSIIISIVVLIILFIIFLKKLNINKNSIDNYLKFSKNNSKQIFTVDRITYFSNCNAEISTNHNSSFTISDLYQYTDIAIFINNHADGKYNASNTLKSIELCDIDFSLKPNHGTPNLYYKNINDFTKPTFDINNIINNRITFEATSDEEIDYSKPILYNNCANPITLTYINSKIKDNYTLSENISNITHNGILLKECNVTLNSISCQINFNIKITNNLDEVFTCPMLLTIPLSTENSTIYDGSLTFKDSTNYYFIKQ